MGEGANLIDGKYSFADLVDIERLREMFEKFSEATGYTAGLISYPDQRLLIGAGWRDICVKFHRACSDSERVCKRSNLDLTARLREGRKLNIRRCESGLVDGATPIIIEGVHVASLATGQILFGPPDPARFRAQAAEYGYDEDAYLAALADVPVVTEEAFLKTLEFLSDMARMLAERGLMEMRVRESERTTRRNERLLAAIYEQAAVGIALVDLDGNVRFVNDAWASMHGFDGGTCLAGEHLRIFHNAEQIREDVEPFNEIVHEKGSYMGEVGHVRRDGTSFPTLMTSTLVRDDDGVPHAIVGVATDLTERVQLTEEKTKLERQFHQAQRMEAVGRLAGGIAHDFNNVLCAILGHASLVLDDLTPNGSLRKHVEEIIASGGRAAELTRHLLAFSRKQIMEPRVLCPNDLVRELHGMLSRLIGEDIEFQFAEGESCGRVRADRGQLEQVVVNLVVNARDAMEDGGRLSLETAPASLDAAYCRLHPEVTPGDYVMLAVTDTGCGMDEATIERCFEPFFSTKETGRGTGLGLASVLGVVLQHGGSVDVVSEPGVGSTFRVYLPRVSDPIEPQARTRQASPPRGTETVLVAEDEEIVREVTTVALERLGYVVLSAPSGRDALRMAADHAGTIDLLLTDVIMPHMNGRELANRLLERRPGLRVLYTSGHPQDVIGQHGVLDEGVWFLGKPFTVQSLAERVRETLDRPDPD